jgi:GNAT superfamily N-acetyltransferase
VSPSGVSTSTGTMGSIGMGEDLANLDRARQADSAAAPSGASSPRQERHRALARRARTDYRWLVSPDRYSVRLAEPRDVASLPAIEIAADELFPEEDLPRVLRGSATGVEPLEAARLAGRLWVAADRDGTPVGFAYVEVVDGHAHLEEIDVLPEHGRRGIGRRLVETVIAWARASGTCPITLTTFRELPWNAPFYASLGFEVLGDEALTPALREVVEHEARCGLDPRRRVVMRFPG